MTRGRPLELGWSEHGGHRCLRVRGWTGAELRILGQLGAPALRRRLAVVPSELVATGTRLCAIQPMAGRFELDQDAICFIPRFPFLDGLSYSLLVDSVLEDSPSDSLEVWTIQRPAPEGNPTIDVVAIYPSTDELPVNQLKLYIHFSGSNERGLGGTGCSCPSRRQRRAP